MSITEKLYSSSFTTKWPFQIAEQGITYRSAACFQPSVCRFCSQVGWHHWPWTSPLQSKTIRCIIMSLFWLHDLRSNSEFWSNETLASSFLCGITWSSSLSYAIISHSIKIQKVNLYEDLPLFPTAASIFCAASVGSSESLSSTITNRIKVWNSNLITYHSCPVPMLRGFVVHPQWPPLASVY